MEREGDLNECDICFTDAASASLDSEILDVVIKYEEEESLKKITMRELRHIIPLLIMRCYNISEEPYQRKGRLFSQSVARGYILFIFPKRQARIQSKNEEGNIGY